MAQSSPYTAHPPEWPRVAQRSLYTSTFTRVLPSTSSTAYPPQVDLAGMRGCQALKYRSSETSQVSTRCVVLFSIKNPFRAEPLFSCEDEFFEGGEFRSKVIFLTVSDGCCLHQANAFAAVGLAKYSSHESRYPSSVTLRSNGRSLPLRLINFAVQELDLFGLLRIIWFSQSVGRLIAFSHSSISRVGAR